LREPEKRVLMRTSGIKSEGVREIRRELPNKEPKIY
jgi:hypothetical protein